ncbi:serine/threonine protein kinase with two-component sensor domain (plasmid) [Leptolyngbya boryana NIES-2135]|uniref:histidine kinase n=1 Tax=Leptolyngbya boryana NIES-2135 TaxID=1973484 RepID=A0A1Z4JSR6_LEPBY|nr:serine/threonine protein kinase with two-component sensor domain [Leptolyngbya boryana NIES-2135]
MVMLPGYEIVEKIYESSKTMVYRGVRSNDQKPVVIKALKNQYPTPREIAVFRKQYSLANHLGILGIVRPYSLENYENQWALVLEDFGAISLRDYCKTHSLSLKDFLSIAIQTTQILGELHRNRIIHKDLKPANLLINSTTGQIKITDFSIASILPKENQALISPNGLEGTLPYLSPEQTGRMNRGIDYRSDFYSLGVTFYQLLTQQLPFISNDPLELVHCHLAKQPISPAELNSAIPVPLSNIVMKLMAKMAEDRYQSATGLLHDLEVCQQQFQLHNTIEAFLLGQQDFCDRLSIPEKLYGRETEVAQLLTAFDRVAQSGFSEFLLVSGYSGIGKSSLVQEVYKPIVQRRGYFIAGKFDQLQRNVPYSAIASAFGSLVQQLLTESELQLRQWQEELAIALGSNGQVIVDVIPELEQIIGKQPEIAALNPTEAQNRFNRVFQNFIRVFCQPEHPLVIFLDDLQWADSATLRLIKLLLTDSQTHHLFLIGAFRDNEVNATHPLTLLLEGLQFQAFPIYQVTLKPLSSAHVTQLISDTLRTHEVSPFVDLLMRKTNGNPFFINEFLKTLYQDELLRFDFYKNSWQWNLKEIETLNSTDNVVELLVDRLRKLPDATQQVIQFAACIGNRFDLKTLSIVLQPSTLETTAQALSIAVQQGLIVPLSALEIVQSDTTEPILVSDRYKFLHDRVQQAAYALIDDREKQSVHLQIGKLLYANYSESSEQLFELVGHFNLGQALITQADEKTQLAHLNIQAAIKAKQAAAYSFAQACLIHAQNHLTETAWSEHYELMFTLHREQAEIEYLLGNFEQSERLIEMTLKQAKSALEKAEIYQLLIVLYTMQGKYQPAIETGRVALSSFEIDIPESELYKAFEDELAIAKTQLAQQKIPALLDQPEMMIPEKRAAARLLTTLGAPTYFSNHDLWLICVMKLVNLSLKHGVISESTYGYSEYGLILGSMLGDYRAGYQFGQLSLKVSERFNNQAEKCKGCVVVGGSVNHWIRPLKEDAEIFMEGYQAGLESGELQFAGYNIAHQVINLFYQGADLDSLQDKLLNYLAFTEQTQNQLAKDMLLACQLIFHSLQECDVRQCKFVTKELSETEYLAACEARSSFAAIGFFKILKAQVLYLYGCFEDAHHVIGQARHLLNYLPGCISLAEFIFYDSLILTSLYLTASELQKSEYWQQIITNQQQMEIWSATCPENFRHQYLLVEAEIARLQNDSMTAIDLYDEAIALAKTNGFVQDSALANELSAKFWITTGKEKLAQIYWIEAYHLYQSWGASTKVADLEQHYPHLLVLGNSSVELSHIADETLSITHISSTSTSSTQILDLSTILKASQAISQEIQLDRLLESLLKVILESAGAERGAILLPEEDHWNIAVQGNSDHTDVILQPLTEEMLSLSIVQYAARTQQRLVIHDATKEPICAADPYVLTHQPKSILCFPIAHKSKLSGIIYLENEQTTEAFSRDRLKVLSLLSTQIAISLENATLYQTLQASEARERERAQQLEKSLQDLQNTQAQLIQTEKISSLGQLVAGVAHEVNNPVGFIAGNLNHTKQAVEDLIGLVQLYREALPQPGKEIENEIDAIDLDFLIADLPQMISSMKLGTDRIREIMQSLRNYSRMDGSEKQLADLHKGIDSTLMILSHRLKATPEHPAIQVIKDYGDLPEVPCFAGQLNQVFMNLIANAIDALEEANRGKSYSELEVNPNCITIQTSIENNDAVIRIKDNGAGMPYEVQQRIFEAFFTTKPEGKGTGLGLPICYQIVREKHGGQLSAVSAIGEGTEFVIQIPIHS